MVYHHVGSLQAHYSDHSPPVLKQSLIVTLHKCVATKFYTERQKFLLQWYVVLKDTYIYTYIHTYIHAYIHTCIHTCIHTYIAIDCFFVVVPLQIKTAEKSTLAMQDYIHTYICTHYIFCHCCTHIATIKTCTVYCACMYMC